MIMAKTVSDARTALAHRRENGGVATNTLADQIRAMEKQFQLAMPRGAEATQLIRDALTALRMTKQLERCEASSVLGALMTCAQLNLRPGVLGHAWLLPFWDKNGNVDDEGHARGGYKAQLVIGYQGLVELAHRSGRIASLIARTVYENDEFDVDYGIADNLIHRPNLKVDRGQPVAYYAIVKFVNGGYAFYAMSQCEVEKYRDRYATARTRATKDQPSRIVGPWADNFEGMAQKTCVRQLAKYMPKSAELALALAVDEGVRVDMSPTMDAAEATRHMDAFVEGEVVADADAAPDAPANVAPVMPPASADGVGVPADAEPADDRVAAELARVLLLFGDAEMADPDQQRQYIAEHLGVPDATPTDLSYVQLARLAHLLTSYIAQSDPDTAGDAQ